MKNIVKNLKFGMIGLMVAAGLAACGGKKQQPVMQPPESFVDLQLREAGESISRDMSILTGSTQNRDFGGISGTGDLYASFDMCWDGPIEGALSRVAARAGFKLIVEGKAPITPVMVHVRLKNRPCLAILREIGMQTGPREGIIVNEPARTILLRYTDDAKGDRK